jgi:hypothetical protein
MGNENSTVYNSIEANKDNGLPRKKDFSKSKIYAEELAAIIKIGDIELFKEYILTHDMKPEDMERVFTNIFKNSTPEMAEMLKWYRQNTDFIISDQITMLGDFSLSITPEHKLVDFIKRNLVSIVLTHKKPIDKIFETAVRRKLVKLCTVMCEIAENYQFLNKLGFTQKLFEFAVQPDVFDLPIVHLLMLYANEFNTKYLSVDQLTEYKKYAKSICNPENLLLNLIWEVKMNNVKRVECYYIKDFYLPIIRQVLDAMEYTDATVQIHIWFVTESSFPIHILKVDKLINGDKLTKQEELDLNYISEKTFTKWYEKGLRLNYNYTQNAEFQTNYMYLAVYRGFTKFLKKYIDNYVTVPEKYRTKNYDKLLTLVKERFNLEVVDVMFKHCSVFNKSHLTETQFAEYRKYLVSKF